jgi:hypothetical protein
MEDAAPGKTSGAAFLSVLFASVATQSSPAAAQRSTAQLDRVSTLAKLL